MAKRRRRESAVEATFADSGTPEARAKGAAERFYSGGGEERWRVTVQIRIDALRALKVISHREFEAGCRVRQDHYLAGMEPRVTVELDTTGGGGKPWGEFSERQLAARSRVNKALGAVTADQCEVILWLVVNDATLAYVGRRRGGISERASRRRGGKLARDALSALADFYGLPGECEK